MTGFYCRNNFKKAKNSKSPILSDLNLHKDGTFLYFSYQFLFSKHIRKRCKLRQRQRLAAHGRGKSQRLDCGCDLFLAKGEILRVGKPVLQGFPALVEGRADETEH